MNAYSYRSARGLVAAISVFMVLLILLGFGAALSTGFQIQLLEEVRAGVEVPEHKLEANDLREGLIGLAQTGAIITVAILFLIWVNRANKNAHALGATGMEYTPGWCVGYYFIPILNLFRPYQCMSEIRKASHPDYQENWRAAPPSALLPLWWALWLISNVVGRIAFRLYSRADTIQEMVSASWASLVSDLLDVPSALLALAVVRTIHGMQEEKLQRLAAEWRTEVPTLQASSESDPNRDD